MEPLTRKCRPAVDHYGDRFGGVETRAVGVFEECGSRLGQWDMAKRFAYPDPHCVWKERKFLIHSP